VNDFELDLMNKQILLKGIPIGIPVNTTTGEFHQEPHFPVAHEEQCI